MPVEFSGGPLAGQGMMTPEEMSGMGEGPSAPPAGSGGGDESAMFETLLTTIRELLGLGTITEQNKLALEKASTLIQQIRASEEKDQDAAMGGTLNPGAMRKLGGAGGSY